MGIGASGITADPDCSRAMDPDMVLATVWAHMTPWPQVAVLVTQICMGLAMAQPLETNMITSGSPDHGHPCGLWSQCRP